MRVLFVESQTELGGAQIALLNLLRSVDRACLEPVFASLGFGSGDLPAQVEALGIPVYNLPAGRFRNLRRTVEKIAALCRVIRREQIDVVLSNSGHPLLYARPAAVWTARPCAWWVHGYFPHDPLRGHLTPYVEHLLSADALLANSEFTARVLREVFQNGTPIRLVRLGVDLQQFRPDSERGAAARHALGIPEDADVVGMFGRLHPFKGQDVFLRAAAMVAAENESCRFLLIGGTPFDLALSYAEGLRKMVHEAGLEKRVQFLGQRSDINDLLNACDVVVHASIEPEPWGLVLAEAMAAGRAVIGAAAGGPLEMIVDGHNGLLTPPGDAVALAGAMKSLLRQPERRRALGEAARRHAEEHFERRAAAAKMCDELQRVCQAHGARA